MSASSIPAPTFAYLASLEWTGARENLALSGDNTGHRQVPHHDRARVPHRDRRAQVKYVTAADLVEALIADSARRSCSLTI